MEEKIQVKYDFLSGAENRKYRALGLIDFETVVLHLM